MGETSPIISFTLHRLYDLESYLIFMGYNYTIEWSQGRIGQILGSKAQNNYQLLLLTSWYSTLYVLFSTTLLADWTLSVPFLFTHFPSYPAVWISPLRWNYVFHSVPWHFPSILRWSLIWASKTIFKFNNYFYYTLFFSLNVNYSIVSSFDSHFEYFITPTFPTKLAGTWKWINNYLFKWRRFWTLWVSFFGQLSLSGTCRALIIIKMFFC